MQLQKLLWKLSVTRHWNAKMFPAVFWIFRTTPVFPIRSSVWRLQTECRRRTSAPCVSPPSVVLSSDVPTPADVVVPALVALPGIQLSTTSSKSRHTTQKGQISLEKSTNKTTRIIQTTYFLLFHGLSPLFFFLLLYLSLLFQQSFHFCLFLTFLLQTATKVVIQNELARILSFEKDVRFVWTYRIFSLFSCSAFSCASRSSSSFCCCSLRACLRFSSSAAPLSKFSLRLSSKVTDKNGELFELGTCKQVFAFKKEIQSSFSLLKSHLEVAKGLNTQRIVQISLRIIMHADVNVC